MRALAQRRRARLAWAVASAALAVLAAALSLGSAAGRLEPPASPGLAAPAYAVRPEAAERIRIATREGGYELVRGSDGLWTVRERGGYPVRAEMVQAFEKGLSELRFGRPMTRDPDKHARLGLGDPQAGGAGIHVQALDARGALLANLILGATPEGAFVRRATEAQSWTLVGDMPPLGAASAWLDMRPFTVDAARVARVDLQPAAGPPYAIVRLTPEQAFMIGAPFSALPVRARELLPEAAGALGGVQPLDVLPAPAVAGAPRGRLTMRTFDGLAVSGELYAQDGRWWLKLIARADTPERAPEAAAINRRSGPWAFAVSADFARRAAPPLDLIAVRSQPQ